MSKVIRELFLLLSLFLIAAPSNSCRLVADGLCFYSCHAYSAYFFGDARER